MNPFLFSVIALCVVAQGAAASYGGHQQRKMAPSPQTYSAPAAYGQQAQTYAAQSYGAPSYGAQQQQHSYEAAPASYEERSSSYGKQTQSYARPAAQSYSAPSYGQQQQQASYAKPAPAAKAYAEPEPQYPPMPFSWGYDLSDGYGAAQYHKETGDEYGKRTGSYGYTDAYGIYRQVDYVADEYGFRATVKSNEPGLQKGQESPASTEFVVYEPPSNYYAGNTNSYSAAAPASSYGSSYSAPSSSYAAPQQPAYRAPSYKSAAPASYQPAQYAAASSPAPTYQKAAAAAAKAY